MSKERLKYRFFILVIILFISNFTIGQSYQKDSLQIKAYTEVEFINGQPQDVVLKKVFCDYCSKKQLKLLGEDAIRRAESDKYDPKNKLKNGIKKIAIYIRIAKKDFAAIREDE